MQDTDEVCLGFPFTLEGAVGGGTGEVGKVVLKLDMGFASLLSCVFGTFHTS